MDWREMAGRPTTRPLPGEGPWKSFNSVWSSGKQVGMGSIQQEAFSAVDPVRSWIIAACWIAASAAEYVPSRSFVHTLSCISGLDMQRILPICARAATKTHPRFHSHSPIQSPRSHYVLRRRHSNVHFLLVDHVRERGRYGHLCGAAMREAGNERRPRGRSHA